MKQVSKVIGTMLWSWLVAFVFFVQIGPAVSAQPYMLVAQVRYPGMGDISHPLLRFEFTGTGPLAPLTEIPASLFNNASYPVFSRQGELFVGNTYGAVGGKGDISRFIFDSDRNFIPNGVITGDLLDTVGGLAFSASGELFAINMGNGIISRFLFDTTGVAIPNGTIITNDWGQGLAFSSSGELFTAHANSVIRRFLFDPSTGEAIPNGSFTVPEAIGMHGVAFNARGELFVSDPYTDNIFRFLFDSAGNPIANGTLSVPGAPLGLAFSGEGELFVASHFVGRLSRFLFDASGNPVANGFVVTEHLEGVSIFPPLTPIISITIDIKPGSPQNTINLGAAGVIPVAILSSSTFNALVEVDPNSLTLAGAKVRVAGKSDKFLCHSEDVNKDGLVDLVCNFENELNAQVGESIAVLQGGTYNGARIRGQASITIVP
jgi:hypothetical protein